METPRTPGYQLVLEGHLEVTWSELFAGLKVDHLATGETRVTGRIDQARLHGLFRVFRDRGVTVRSLNPVLLFQEEE